LRLEILSSGSKILVPCFGRKNRVVEIRVCDDIRNPKNPKRYGQVVDAWRQQILYDPLTAAQDPVHGANDAHSLIIGRKKAAVREAIVSNSTWYDIWPLQV
jgi:hypothetical protein